MAASAEGREPWMWRRVREKAEYRQINKENVSQRLGKQEGLNFVSSCNQQGLKPGVLKVSGLGKDKAQRALHCSRR